MLEPRIKYGVNSAKHLREEWGYVLSPRPEILRRPDKEYRGIGTPLE